MKIEKQIKTVFTTKRMLHFSKRETFTNATIICPEILKTNTLCKLYINIV